jgi:hypothetical protein
MQPSALEINAGDFPLAAGHRRIALSFVAGTLNSAVNSAVAASGAATAPSRTAFAAIM